MAPVIVDPAKIREFRSADAFYKWLGKNHDKADEIWIKMHKKASELKSINAKEAIDVVLCWGWIDGIRKSFDGLSFLQRFTPRKAKSIWSQVNRENIARLSAAGRMTPHGHRHVEAAQADGRWDNAYAPIRKASEATIPDDLRAAINANARARRKFKTLGRMNLFALAFRTNNMKTPAGRARKIAALVEMLARGETIVPEKAGGAR